VVYWSPLLLFVTMGGQPAFDRWVIYSSPTPLNRYWHCFRI